MLVSICGTPGVGKTTLSMRLEKIGWRRIDLKELILSREWDCGIDKAGGELIVDKGTLMEGLTSEDFDSNTVIDGHLSYLAPSDITIVLRLDPRRLKDRLESRDYSKEKINENIEAEAVSVVLVEAMQLEDERTGKDDWRSLLAGKGIVFEIDTSDLSTDKILEKTLNIIDGYRRKRLNELVEYRPGKIDWLEAMAQWS